MDVRFRGKILVPLLGLSDRQKRVLQGKFDEAPITVEDEHYASLSYPEKSLEGMDQKSDTYRDTLERNYQYHQMEEAAQDLFRDEGIAHYWSPVAAKSGEHIYKNNPFVLYPSEATTEAEKPEQTPETPPPVEPVVPEEEKALETVTEAESEQPVVQTVEKTPTPQTPGAGRLIVLKQGLTPEQVEVIKKANMRTGRNGENDMIYSLSYHLNINPDSPADRWFNGMMYGAEEDAVKDFRKHKIPYFWCSIPEEWQADVNIGNPFATKQPFAQEDLKKGILHLNTRKHNSKDADGKDKHWWMKFSLSSIKNHLPFVKKSW